VEGYYLYCCRKKSTLSRWGGGTKEEGREGLAGAKNKRERERARRKSKGEVGDFGLSRRKKKKENPSWPKQKKDFLTPGEEQFFLFRKGVGLHLEMSRVSHQGGEEKIPNIEERKRRRVPSIGLSRG